MSARRVLLNHEVTVTSDDLIAAFPKEWADAQLRGLDEDAFLVESIRECDWQMLVDLGSDEFDDLEHWPVAEPRGGETAA